MSKVEFKLDYKKDAYNYWKIANNKSTWGSDFSKNINQDIIKTLKGKSWEDSKDYIYSLLSRDYKKHKKLIIISLTSFENAWRLIEKDYFKRLEELTKHKIYTDKFTAYLTTASRCPYNHNNNWFMVGLYYNIPSVCQIAGHELMHLQFHKYYWEKCREELNEEKTHDLKESLTVLLNEEFSDLFLAKDKGYPNHQKLREYIVKSWRKTKDFDKTVDNGIKYLKSN